MIPDLFGARGRVLAVVLALAAPAAAAAPDWPGLLAERVRSVVAVEYMTETETERRPTVAMGTVIDGRGTVILQAGAIEGRVPLGQLREFRVYRAGDAVGGPAVYLGQDAYTGWHFVRADAATGARLRPVGDFAAAGGRPPPAVAEPVWGIGLRPKEEDFQPYLLRSHVALLQSLPQVTAIAQQEVASPGLPVFDAAGRLVGLAAPSGGQTFLQISRQGRPTPTMLINVEESSAFLVAEEVLPHFGRVPASPSGRPLAWLGTYGLEPMDREVAKFLQLTSQSGVVVSEVLEGSPAETAGLRGRDIILALDGRPLPALRPDRVVVTFLEREIDRRRPGDPFPLTVLRGAERREIAVVLGEQPKLVREAERRHFERLGLTAREFVYGDAVERRGRPSAAAGIIAHLVKPSSPVATAGLRADDWVREIDGVEVRTFAEAATRLGEIEADSSRPEFVLLVSRGNETAVLRVRLR